MSAAATGEPGRPRGPPAPVQAGRRTGNYVHSPATITRDPGTSAQTSLLPPDSSIVAGTATGFAEARGGMIPGPAAFRSASAPWPPGTARQRVSRRRTGPAHPAAGRDATADRRRGLARATRLQVDSAAQQAARAACLARDPATATSDADATATTALASENLTCAGLAVNADLSDFQPGGQVTVQVTCAVSVSGLALLHLPGSRTLTYRFTAPIDVYRGRTLGFSNSKAPMAANPSIGGM
jgi:hypothetical protein